MGSREAPPTPRMCNARWLYWSCFNSVIARFWRRFAFPRNAWQLRPLGQASEVNSLDNGPNLVVVNEFAREGLSGVFNRAPHCC